MKKYILIYLEFLSKKIIHKHKPFVIGITGTVGKTTTTNFVYDFLSGIYPNDVYKSEFDYNGEFGLPLSILKSSNPNKNIFLRIALFFKFLRLFYTKNYPKFLILEYGVDHIGEMEFMTSIVSPNISILLNIAPNHISQFGNFDDYIKEKILLGKKSSVVIYNFDDPNLNKIFKNSKNSFSYSKNNSLSNIFSTNIKSDLSGLSFEINSLDEKIEVNYNLLGDFQVYNILPIFGLAKALNISFEKVGEVLKDLTPQKGRGTILKGVNDSIIIDGSYNGGFLSISNGVEFVQSLGEDLSKILFLGEMRELAGESKKIHTELSEILLKGNFNYLVLVGEDMQKYVYPVLVEKFGKDKVFYFKSSKDAGEKIREIIKLSSKKSLIYVKGSQNTIFLEEGIKKFLFDSKDFNKLCRQSKNWLVKKEEFFSHII